MHLKIITKVTSEIQSPLAYLRTLCPQKMRKYMRSTDYTYYISCFLIWLPIKSRL